jgi:two-component system response regulator HydG
MQRKGRFEYAQGGTLFLDEVGDLPFDIQVKLLRVIEEREIIRVGSNVPIPVDVRLVAATNRDLGTLVSQGKFREDLFFRLNVVSLRLPPLRERKEELSLFIERFMPEFARGFGKKVTSISLEARKILFRHDWPGNVRELRNAIESMVAVTRAEVLGVGDLPDYLMARSAAATAGMAPGLTMKEAQRRLVQGTLDMVRGSRAEAAKILEIPEESVIWHLRPPPGTPPGGVHPAHRVDEILPGMTVEAVERILIRETLESVEGNRKKAARMLAIGERTLYRKIRQYGLG